MINNPLLKKNVILKAALIITVATLLSKVLGLVRFQLMFYLFGVGAEMDAFWSGFRIPNAMRDLLAEGAFSSSFVMICTRVMVLRGKQAAIDFTNRILSFFSVFMVGFCLLLFLLGSPLLNYFIVGLYHQNETTLWLAAYAFEILLPFLFILALASLFMGFLNSHDTYWAPAIAPFASNVVFIITLVIIQDSMKITGIAIAYIFGAFTQLVLQWVVSIKTGWRFRWIWDFKDRYVREFLLLYVPILLIMAIPKITGFITNGYATSLAPGSLSIYEWAFIIIQLPISIFVTGLSIVSLTNLSKYYEQGSWHHFRELVQLGIRLMVLYALPGVAVLLVMPTQIAQFIYKDFAALLAGNETSHDIQTIGTALFYLAPGLFSMSLSIIFIRAYQGMKEWKAPLLISIVMLSIHAVLSYVLGFVFDLKLHGVILSFVIASYSSCILLGFFLLKQAGPFTWSATIKTFFQALAGAVLVAGFLLCIQWVLGYPATPLHNIISVIGKITGAVLLYTWIMVLFGQEEYLSIVKKILGRFIRFK